jgi:POT family proton-dependent oligopeptide transporter
MLQFWLSQNIFVNIGLKPNKELKASKLWIPINFSPIQLAAIAFFYFSFVMVTERSCFKISGGKVNVFAFHENGNAIAILQHW